MTTSIQPVIFFLQAHHAENQTLWETIVQSNFLNFVIAFVFLAWLIQRFNLFSILDQRQAKIVNTLKEAEDRRKKALQDLDEIEKRTASLASEVDAILREAQETAEMVSQAIVKDAQDEADKMLSQAQRRIEQERKTAARELEQRLMQEAVYAARQLLENTLDEDEKKRSVEDFVVSLPELYRKEYAQ